jgi:hypothetical protein
LSHGGNGILIEPAASDREVENAIAVSGKAIDVHRARLTNEGREGVGRTTRESPSVAGIQSNYEPDNCRSLEGSL